MKTLRTGFPLLAALWMSVTLSVSAPAATLEKLTNERLIDESSDIVRATVTYCNTIYRAPAIWTVCELAITESFKGIGSGKVFVYIPGGTASGFRQTIEGAPALERNTEYLFFLWQGKSGMRQIMGLSQGLMNIGRDAKGNLVVLRAKTDDRMVDAQGNEVSASDLRLGYSEMVRLIKSRASKAGMAQ